MVSMYVVKIDGKAASMTNNFDSAIFYAELLKGEGHRVTIRSLLPQDVEPVMDSMFREERQAGAAMSRAS